MTIKTSSVYFISDLHLGHAKILNFAGAYRGGSTPEEHDEWIVDQWNSVITKRNVVYLLGDVCFHRDAMHHLERLKGMIRYCPGNHDRKYLKEIIEHLNPLETLPGLSTYKKFWVTHCPIHPDEMRGRNGNIHGHVHQNILSDQNYYPVCVEQCYGVPICFDEIYSAFERNRESIHPI